jgi:DNA-binding MarR family transcriptional regulator
MVAKGVTRLSALSAPCKLPGVASNTRKTAHRTAKSPAANKVLHDHIVARTTRLADAMVRMSSHHMSELWNLRHTDLRLMNILEGEEPLTVNQISRNALVDQAWVSRSLRALESVRLVERRRDPQDSRLTLVSLTKRGREILEEFRPYAAWSERLLLQGIDERKLKSLLDQLEANTLALMDALEDMPRMPKR